MPQMPTLSELAGLVVLAGINEPRDPVRQIAAAEQLASDLNMLGNSLIGLFVEMARAEGCSWADIGAPRGLSKQGAQQRYAPFLAWLTVDDLVSAGVVQRFDEEALRCLRRAETRAGQYGRDAVDSGDLLAAVLDDPAGLAGAVLRAFDVDPSDVRAALEREPDSEQPVEATGRTRPGIGPDARRAIDGAVAEADGHGVAAAHLFLGLLRAPGSRAGKVLTDHGVTRRAALAIMLGLAGRSTPGPA
ncbi:Clp protease N-terminal domain-containing protein [Streptacidiphilus sp. N1-10]|uniref:Clp protease N-terminal domain-containing protein n=1 Tax=Streptacidiphilus jeojiensis TaxID=3229225 RepID=A0ABV6XEG5_9ACTN